MSSEYVILRRSELNGLLADSKRMKCPQGLPWPKAASDDCFECEWCGNRFVSPVCEWHPDARIRAYRLSEADKLLIYGREEVNPEG